MILNAVLLAVTRDRFHFDAFRLLALQELHVLQSGGKLLIDRLEGSSIRSGGSIPLRREFSRAMKGGIQLAIVLMSPPLHFFLSLTLGLGRGNPLSLTQFDFV